MTYESLEERAAQRQRETLDEFDAFQFISHLRSRWKTLMAACGVAVVLALTVSWLLPNKYTATASILIEPPAGNDPRAATAVSPVYLESLKTYEHFASSDTLFRQALQHLKLRSANDGEPMESLKKRVLRVSKPRDTKILEISVTWRDPVQAQALAEYIARQTVGLNKMLDDRSQHDLTAQSGLFLDAAADRVNKAEKARLQFVTDNPMSALQDEIAAALKLKSQIQSDLSYAKSELAGYQAQEKARLADRTSSSSPSTLSEGIVSSRAHIDFLEQEQKDVDQQIAKNSGVLEKRKQQHDLLETELRAARAQYEMASTKNSDILSSAAFRGERLQIVDPGVTPQRPSSPNVPLNLAIGLLASMLGWFLYASMSYSYSRLSAYRRSSEYLPR
jgi:uncharacterized protein involved in exopolysaccharide biosynthesis